MNGLYRRVASAMRRRGRYWKAICWDGPRLPLAQGTLGWIQNAGRTKRAVAPSLVSGCAASLWDYGQRETVQSWLSSLTQRHSADGSFSESAGGQPSLLVTAQVLDGLLHLEPDFPNLATSIDRCCRFLLSRIDSRGELATGHISSGLLDACVLPEMHFVTLAPLLKASRRHGETAWEGRAMSAVRRLRRGFQPQRWQDPSHRLASVANALIDLELLDDARLVLMLPAAVQRADGAVPAFADSSWISSSGLAQLAGIWCRQGERDRADRAISCLHRHQLTSGGFPGGWGPAGQGLSKKDDPWTAKFVLDAALSQVEAAFADQAPFFAEIINECDGRLRAVRNWVASQPVTGRVADVGCGKGRYLRHLTGWHPGIQFTGIDVSRQMLAHLPKDSTGCIGNLLRLPIETGSFDAAFAVESIEHALVPEQAIAELCRIVRPGGSVLILDKNRALQPLSVHETWERWFTPSQVCHSLARYCDAVTVEAVPHGGTSLSNAQRLAERGGMQADLFLAWSGSRKATTAVSTSVETNEVLNSRAA